MAADKASKHDSRSLALTARGSQSYYDMFGVDRSASANDIKRAYRKAAREMHPVRARALLGSYVSTLPAQDKVPADKRAAAQVAFVRMVSGEAIANRHAARCWAMTALRCAAYEVLTNAVTRARYDELLGESGCGSDDGSVVCRSRYRRVRQSRVDSQVPENFGAAAGLRSFAAPALTASLGRRRTGA